MSKPSDHEQEVIRRLNAIDHKSNSMQDSLAWLVSASPQLKEKLLDTFGESQRRAQVFLGLDGKRTVDALAAHLGMQSQNVTTELRTLKKRRLIDVVDVSRAGKVYSKSQLDAILGLSEDLAAKFNLTTDGKRNG